MPCRGRGGVKWRRRAPHVWLSRIHVSAMCCRGSKATTPRQAPERKKRSCQAALAPEWLLTCVGRGHRRRIRSVNASTRAAFDNCGAGRNHGSTSASTEIANSRRANHRRDRPYASNNLKLLTRNNKRQTHRAKCHDCGSMPNASRLVASRNSRNARHRNSQSLS